MPTMPIVHTKSQTFFDIFGVAEGKSNRLDRAAFNRPTLRIARNLIGKFIVRRYQGSRLSGMITEVEAYLGPRDRASHAYGGRRTPRVEPLYADGGTVYVYLVYGLHWLLNFSTAGRGIPEGILIRGILAGATEKRNLILGPGRVTRHLMIDKGLDGVDATSSKHIWIEDRGMRISPKSVRTGPRIGVDYAGPYWAARPWRFWIDVNSIDKLNSSFVNRTEPGKASSVGGRKSAR
jgi:DNA-3-methyladenine glycosylase